ncbi:hypothetical protein MBCUT_10510 [Methanobrevibacter cuticularis]|uniref:PRC-barrel domain-containing protein n=1 Tax=Methanobrevibacter cuticularis TaxID=47311 RepID=A0A166E1W2_9EURY|nr:PRC-barrel domain-containing protein [Methanobrevibacter cuticularis]KZX16185.1 hypothetical protein MBCUT_10510 [Methanobrevibacter cuticularis]
MNLKDILGMDVVDKHENSVGSVHSIDIDESAGCALSITTTSGGALLADTNSYGFDQIDNISNNVKLNIVID